MCLLPPNASSMFKRRSAHASSDPQRPVISNPTNFVKVEGMGSPNGARTTTANPQMSEIGNGAPLEPSSSSPDASGEPIVHDFQALYPPPIFDVPPPRTPIVHSPKFRPLSSHPIHSSSDEDSAPPPPDLTRKGIAIHIPTRTSSKAVTQRRYKRSASRTHSLSSTPESHRHSPVSSVRSNGESSGSPAVEHFLSPSPRQAHPDTARRLSPLLEDDPSSFDLVAADEDLPAPYSLEQRSDLLFSREHLEAIFRDTQSLLRFTSFLSAFRPDSLPVLIYYLDALKALRAINYANAVAEALEPLEGHDFTLTPARTTVNAVLEDKARRAFDVLIRDDLPAFITHVFIQVVSVNIRKRITGHLSPLQQEASEGLAEVFCLSDPSRPDNPIVFASEEFHRTTQYGVNYAIGRNCRFLQGPRTSPHSISRLRAAIREGKEINEVILNYRRDGSPFMNLLMVAPLLDARGKLRYYIGAQVDVSGLVADCTDLDAYRRVVDAQEGKASNENEKDEFQELSEMFNNAELETVRKYGGSMHREHLEESDDASLYYRPRQLPRDPSSNGDTNSSPGRLSRALEGTLTGVYKNYLLLRPYPSLRILFTSPSLRVPGILQSRFLDRIGGSTRVRDSLAEALADGKRGVTAKIRWLSSPSSQVDIDQHEEGRQRWIHCTPLHSQAGTVGVWMIVLVDDDKDALAVRKFRHAPPVAKEIRRASYSAPSHLNEILDSDDEGEADLKSRWRRSLRHPAVEAMRRPESAMSGLRSQSRSPSQALSVNSFAL